MTDLDLLTGAIAARIRAMPDVRRLYPPRTASLPGAIGGAAAVLSALAADDTVTLEVHDGVTRVQVDLAASTSSPAPETALAVAAAVRGVLDGAGIVERRITVRVASVEA